MSARGIVFTSRAPQEGPSTNRCRRAAQLCCQGVHSVHIRIVGGHLIGHYPQPVVGLTMIIATMVSLSVGVCCGATRA